MLQDQGLASVNLHSRELFSISISYLKFLPFFIDEF